MKKIFFTIAFIGLFLSGCDSNKEIKKIIHPSTNEELAILVLSGFDDDITYLVNGELENGELNKKVNFVAFNDSFGVTTEGDQWVIYHLGEIFDSNNPTNMNIILKKIDKIKYREIIDESDIRFLYRYYF